MQINDDTIRSAFAWIRWPVYYDRGTHFIYDGADRKIFMVGGDYMDSMRDTTGLTAGYLIESCNLLGETIAEMLNERYHRPSDYAECKNQFAHCAKCARMWKIHSTDNGACLMPDGEYHPTNRFTRRRG